MVCVGLDVDLKKIPDCIRGEEMYRVREFAEKIIESTYSIAGFYKPNCAFYEKFGKKGLEVLKTIIEYINFVNPAVPVILDYKRADIGTSNLGYIDLAFGYLNADAVTVNPFFGRGALVPFLEQEDKGIIVLCRTSNPQSDEFQNLSVSGNDVPKSFMPLYQYIAHRVSEHWNGKGNCALVAGATHPEELGEIRKIVGDMPLLIPGVGAQGGDVEATVANGRNSKNQGMIINSSRGIIYASSGEDFGRAAFKETTRLTNEIIVDIGKYNQ